MSHPNLARVMEEMRQLSLPELQELFAYVNAKIEEHRAKESADPSDVADDGLSGAR